ncbi:MAG TPA: glycosyltransferase family 4 protein [Vicinamibacterales bacterium]|nr:glycosyltransferase family 4 protein [Vicinamibacterales bacterium]
MKTGRDSLSVVQVNYAFDNSLSDPDALLARYTTLTGWSRALLHAGAERSAVVQRFHRAARIVRDRIEYVFVERALASATAALSADVVHVNGLGFGAQTWRLRRSLPPSVAIVVQNHSDTGPMGRAPVARLIGKATRAAVDAFLFAADEHADRWRRAGFIGPRQRTYQVMEASTGLAPMPRADAKAVTGVDGSPAILWVGRLNANKDPLTILDAFERALTTLPGATLTMVYGASDLLGDVRARIERNATLRERVRLAGAVPHDRIAAYCSAADLFVLGSHHEGSGYALIEALACGLPPAVTDIPSFRVLTGGGVGALWQPGDAGGCARAIVALAQRDPGAERSAVRQHFERHVSWDAIGQRALAIYGAVLDARGSS